MTARANKALKRTKRPRGASVARTLAPRAHSRTGALPLNAGVLPTTRPDRRD
jgi:hypothetical protein